MQVLDQNGSRKDYVHVTIAESGFILHRLVNGAYQVGSGEDGKIVESVEDVSMFSPGVQADVKKWLEQGGADEAKEEVRAIEMAEVAAKHPGTLDTMVLEAGGKELLGQMYEFLKGVLKSKGFAVPAENPEQPPAQVLSEGKLIVNEHGNREFIPNDDAVDEAVQKDIERERAILNGQVPALDVAPSEADPEPGSMGDLMVKDKAKARVRRPRN
jgi:hypothetical protein